MLETLKFDLVKKEAKELRTFHPEKSWCQCLELIVRSYGYNSLAHYQAFINGRC